MITIVSINLNGIRSAARKGFFDWLQQQSADVVCVQETRAQFADITHSMTHPGTYQAFFDFAVKKGYSGVGLYSKVNPDRVWNGFGSEEFDAEGRYIRCDYGNTSIISLYVPSGSSSDERQQAKFRFMDVFLPHLEELAASARDVIICGDWNVAHREIDLKNWKSNRKNSGFLPEERAWMSHIFDKLGWVDVYRQIHPNEMESAYTWWSNRGQAYANNVGWRIDYQVATRGIASKAVLAMVYKDIRFSDHAPLIIRYDVPCLA
ncbi:MAG: exodeoxyribonuclease III [Burkholderiaceae bacterium]|jgi:exodeoxyribonuclease-3|nr:exodeoxyribonuclease III [Burkholderiaceae bacterium]